MRRTRRTFTSVPRCRWAPKTPAPTAWRSPRTRWRRALSQGSLLLLPNESLIEPLYEHVNDLGFVELSFSYPILASIELASDSSSKTATRSGIERSSGQRCFASRLRAAGHDLLRPRAEGRPGLNDFDPTRVTLNVVDTGLTGFEFERRLHRVSIYPEMATLEHVLFLVTPGTSIEDVAARDLSAHGGLQVHHGSPVHRGRCRRRRSRRWR